MPSPYQPHQRFTEADRDKIAGRLRDAFADGRLDQPEFTARLDRLYGAQTYGELEPLVRDLPPVRTYQTPAMVENVKPAPEPGTFPERKKPNQPQNKALQHLTGGFTGVVLLNVVIWFVIGLGNGGDWPAFWPVWLLIPWALFAFSNLGKRR
ncbi:protein of unknown function DUF1707 [Kribbella flavida DSM 17836]|uniref:DUF1707 domain-containing protein n=1 Tax=Kribbella flavida (strain DSM 17836 / JCM 10339 / NBRC 14399) TaxID=479435 RepID=D2PU60_KRIFD|nr:DUF1707 domain-containing protein [Kribbella flavida]ADB35111.1 protein of unknown function DUF1707 [Kribbella flavida DSM 17836]